MKLSRTGRAPFVARPPPAEARLQLAAQSVEALCSTGMKPREAVNFLVAGDRSLDSKNGEIGGKLIAYLAGKRGASRRRRR
jgi:hypothetical protein